MTKEQVINNYILFLIGVSRMTYMGDIGINLIHYGGCRCFLKYDPSKCFLKYNLTGRWMASHYLKNHLLNVFPINKEDSFTFIQKWAENNYNILDKIYYEHTECKIKGI